MPKRGRPSSRSATRQSRVAHASQQASLQSPLSRCERGAGPFFPALSKGRFRGVSRGMDAQPRAGRPHVEPTDVYPSPAARGRLQRASEAREGESKEDGGLRTATPVAAPSSMPAVWRRGPRLETVASGLAHRSAQHLTPLGVAPCRKAEAMEREGAEVRVLRPTLEARASSYGPDDPKLIGLPSRKLVSKPEKDSHMGVDIQTRPENTPSFAS